MNGEEIEVAFPLRIAPDGIWLGLGSVQRLEISTSAVLPDSGLPVPEQLWDIEVGTMHIRELANGWRAGGMLRVGSPSDRPFAALRDMTVTLLGFLTIPSGERDAWNFSLFYSPTGQIIFPIPGVAYVWRPTPQFQANLGIPFSLDYRPTETLTITASYRPLNNVQVLVRQSLGEAWSIYGGYRTVNDTFLLADRLDDRERTYLFDQRLTLGVQRELGRGWSLDLSAAYVFDRQIFQAEKFSGSRRDELAIDPGATAFGWCQRRVQRHGLARFPRTIPPRRLATRHLPARLPARDGRFGVRLPPARSAADAGRFPRRVSRPADGQLRLLAANRRGRRGCRSRRPDRVRPAVHHQSGPRGAVRQRLAARPRRSGCGVVRAHRRRLHGLPGVRGEIDARGNRAPRGRSVQCLP